MKSETKANRPAPREWALLLGLLLLAVGVFFFSRALAPAGQSVLVEQNGETVFRAALGEITEPKTLFVNGTEIEITREGARFLSSGCPDKVCVKSGLLTRAGESAICLPNRVSLRLTGGGGADAVTG